jgi:hypothetical protein
VVNALTTFAVREFFLPWYSDFLETCAAEQES